MRNDSCRRAREGEAGIVSLEMALVTPLLLLLIAGALTVGHALYVRFRLCDHAAAAARACALSGTSPQACADATWARVKQELKSCGWLRVRVNRTPVPDLDRVKGLTVRLECRYSGGVARTLLAKEGITFNTLTASALMPY